MCPCGCVSKQGATKIVGHAPIQTDPLGGPLRTISSSASKKQIKEFIFMCAVFMLFHIYIYPPVN